MKSTSKFWFTTFLSAIVLAIAFCFTAVPTTAITADTGNITCITSSGDYLNDDYISVYKVPTSMMTYQANGGSASGQPISNAFDGNWNSFWRTATENNGQTNANPSFLNAITVSFSEPVTIGRIVYASSSERTGHGYPTILNLYTANNGDLSLYGTCTSRATNNRVVFTLQEAVTVTQLKFEFRQVNMDHNWTATAKEICFLQPDNTNANKVLDLFDDYAQYNVKEEYRTILSQLRSEVSGLISYESALKPLLDRADAIVSGELVKDSRREFSTDPNAENVINRYGDLRDYADRTLKMSRFGINHQVLGIGGLTGQKITIYVEADEGDPLPQLACTQVRAHTYVGWKTHHNLSRGKNVITFPNFITDAFSTPVVAGGPIHLLNPYEPSQQSSNVKIYIEGGYLYPVFRKGDDVASFRADLTAYRNQMQETPGMSDVTELVGDHFIHTVSATNAYNSYVNNSVNPQTNAERWDNYLKTLLEFGGVSFNPQDSHYNEKNLHLLHNFRMAQPLGGVAAYSGYDHIGYVTFGEGGLINFGNQGWGVAHEIGHALDVGSREITETTNNMWAKFAMVYFEKNVSDKNYHPDVTNAITSDEKVAQSSGYFNQHRDSFTIWWDIESFHHGFWGKLDNLYRYFDENAARSNAGVTAGETMTKTERMVYYSSLAIGEDLGYYYERCGFSFETDANAGFKVETASAAYKKLIAKALEDGEIIEKGFKYWYADANQYNYDASKGSCYTSSSNVEIRDILKSSSGYTLLFSGTGSSEKHLGYEIMEYRNGNWYVIGFAYSDSYTDTTKYADGYVPQYKICAYDRGTSKSAESEPVTYEAIDQTSSCRIGETYYSSITLAVAAASAGSTIYVCKDLYDANIVINKDLTILPDPTLTNSVVIKRCAVGPMFTVNGGATLTLGDSNATKTMLVLDGNSFSQSGTLIKVNAANAALRAYNIELRNNLNKDYGGAVYNLGNSEFTKVSIKNNTTSLNGGAITNSNGGIVKLTDCILTGNIANQKGGALSLDGRTTLIRTSIKGNTAKDVGGAIFMSCIYDARSVSIEGGEISGNTAKNGDAIYLDNGTLTLENGSAALSGEIYKKNATTLNISGALPDLSNASFRTPSGSAESVLLTATGDLTFTEADLENIKVNSFGPDLGSDGKTILIPLTYVVTFNMNGTNVMQDAKPGNFILPQFGSSAPEGKKFSHWEISGVSYNIGDTVNITGDTTITAVFEDLTEDDISGKGNAGLIVIIVIIVCLVVIGTVVALIFVMKTRRRKKIQK